MDNKKVSVRRAALHHAVLLLASIAIIFYGVVREHSPRALNGLPTFFIVVPVSSFSLSLINWFFIRLYKSKKIFSICSTLISICSILCGYALLAFHEGLFDSCFSELTTFGFFVFITDFCALFIGMFLLVLITIFIGLLAKYSSVEFAEMLGKE